MYMRRAIRLQQKKKQKVKYKVGQTVRVQYKKEKVGSRSYNEQAGSQRYIITRIDAKSRRHPLYFLSDEKGRELSGGAVFFRVSLYQSIWEIHIGEGL